VGQQPLGTQGYIDDT